MIRGEAVKTEVYLTRFAHGLALVSFGPRLFGFASLSRWSFDNEVHFLKFTQCLLFVEVDQKFGNFDFVSISAKK